MDYVYCMNTNLSILLYYTPSCTTIYPYPVWVLTLNQWYRNNKTKKKKFNKRF